MKLFLETTSLVVFLIGMSAIVHAALPIPCARGDAHKACPYHASERALHFGDLARG